MRINPFAKNRKGFLQIVEVVIAGLLIFYYLGYLSSVSQYTQTAVDENVRLKKLAEDTLITLDNIPRDTPYGTTTVLRDDLNRRDHADLINATAPFIQYPYSYSYEITYANETYLSKKLSKKLTASANYLVFDVYEGKPGRYAVKLIVWTVG